MHLTLLALCACVLALHSVAAESRSKIDRKSVVQAFNPRRNASSSTTPLQVGNGNFAFGADVTGLQTFNPFASMTTWGWHNFSLPTTPGQTEPSDFVGLDWWTHGRLVNYDQPNPAQPDISNWLIENPQRLNLGTIGFSFSNGQDVTEDMLQDKTQVLDLWTGQLSSSFKYNGSTVSVETWADATSATVGISVKSKLLSSGSLGMFFDYPYPDVNKFDAPFVGVFNATSNHTTNLLSLSQSATIQHILDNTTYYTAIEWGAKAEISGPAEGTHRYFLQPSGDAEELTLSVTFSPLSNPQVPSFEDITTASTQQWDSYWNLGGFVDLTGTDSPNATELQRRIILSQYLTAVNQASSNPPQESGLVNNGWYGKFHLEMVLWHTLHFARWNKYSLLRSVPGVYENFLPTSLSRASLQGYAGARWGKMSDPTGRSAPGEINSLLIWQQPHAAHFAEIEYRSFSTAATLSKWDGILTPTADFMASYAFFNTSTGVYDLGPPMYPVSENTAPNATINPAFEIAYWRFGLDVAIAWKERQNLSVPEEWTHVRDNLPPLPTADGAFAVYEGIPDMWEPNTTTVQDHPAFSAIFGLLPPPRSGPPLNMTVVRNTADKILELWDFEGVYGWDFSMVAMNSLRLGDVDQAVAYLLDEYFVFDDAGYAEGGSRVATPYFPDSSSLLLAVAMMAGGWDGEPGPHFPEGWDVQVEGFIPGL
ncbi:Six-hairpin glycosidase-like protein [Xylariaceae sp. FL0255]|nr:Six-hairpin glycosidase-like protein [Xylariaceae sp. FL0255]